MRPTRYRYRKSATVTTSPPDVPVSLPSSIFDFVPGTSPSWSPKVCVSDGRTPYIHRDHSPSLREVHCSTVTCEKRDLSTHVRPFTHLTSGSRSTRKVETARAESAT